MAGPPPVDGHGLVGFPWFSLVVLGFVSPPLWMVGCPPPLWMVGCPPPVDVGAAGAATAAAAAAAAAAWFSLLFCALARGSRLARASAGRAQQSKDTQ